MFDVSGDGDWDQIETADAAIGRIESDPTGPRHIDLRPGVGRAGGRQSDKTFVPIVEIAGHDARAEAKAAGRFHEENCKVSASPPTAVECLDWRLRALVVAALIRDP